MCYLRVFDSVNAITRYPPDGILTSTQKFHDVGLDHLIEPESSGDCLDVLPDHQFLLTSTEEFNTMITGEDEPSSGLNGRLRPRKSNVHSPQNKLIRKTDGKIAQDKPKRTSTPSKASPNKPDDLGNKSDTPITPQLLCPYCDKKFANRQTISQHVRRTHLSPTKHELYLRCLFCNHAESDANDIIRHMVDSHPNQYFACLDCHTRFSSTSDLAEHKLNVCEKQKPSYRSKLRQKASIGAKKNQKRINIDNKSDFHDGKEFSGGHAFNGIVISCELKPSHIHDESDIEHNITTNLILPPSKSLSSTVIEKNAIIVLDDIHWNKRIPPNFSFHNTDADQILSRLGVVHRSPRTGESTRRDWFKAIDDSTQKFEKCFDTAFYSKVASNVQENLAKFLDGSFNFNPDVENTIKTRKSKNSVAINTAEGFPILLAYEQYSRNIFDGSMPRAIAPKHKWKWDNLEHDKSVLNPDQIKRDTHVNNCIITLVSSLDIWTQLCMRRKFEVKFGKLPLEKKTEKQNIIGRELKDILESREIPASSSQLVKYASIPLPNKERLDFPAFLGLAPSAPTYDLQPAVLSGEWVRPRCYVCCACGAQTRDSRALSSHISTQHPNAQVQHYEIVGEPLIKAGISKHLYVPPSQMCNRTRPLRGFRDCTKCGKSITLEDLHQHMLDCAGDAPAVRRKCRYRPFGVRRRRPRLPDNTIRQKIRKDIRTRQRQKGHLRPRPIRTDVGDETIRKMIADLPAKRHRVISNPLKPILRSRKIFDKQRNKVMMKRRSSEDSKYKKKPRFVKETNSALDLTKNDSKKNTICNIDNDVEPSIPSLEHEIEKAKNSEKSVEENMTSHEIDLNTLHKYDNQEPEIPEIGPIDLRAEQQHFQNEPKDIDINGGPFSVREHGNNNSNNRNNQQQQDESRQDANQENNIAPAPNTPLKHSIARLTANSETHDKSVQFHHSFLIQQECNNVTQNIHVPAERKQLFEDEDVVIKLDKPPLQIEVKGPPDHYTDAQKAKLIKSKKRLNDCITMLRKKLVEPASTALPAGKVSVQCGDDEPLDPNPFLAVQIAAEEPKIDSPAQVYSRAILMQSNDEKSIEIQQNNHSSPFEDINQPTSNRENNGSQMHNNNQQLSLAETDGATSQDNQKRLNETAIPEYDLQEAVTDKNDSLSSPNKQGKEKASDMQPQNASNPIQHHDSNIETVVNEETHHITVDIKETRKAKKSKESHSPNASTDYSSHKRGRNSHKGPVNISESNYILNRFEGSYLQSQAQFTATDVYSQYAMNVSMPKQIRCDNESDIYLPRMTNDYLQSMTLQNLTEESSYSFNSELYKRNVVNAMKNYELRLEYDNLRSSCLDKSGYINHDSHKRTANTESTVNKRQLKNNLKQKTVLSAATKKQSANESTLDHIRRNLRSRGVVSLDQQLINDQSKTHSKLKEIQLAPATSSKYKYRDSYERDLINVGTDIRKQPIQSAMHSSSAALLSNIHRDSTNQSNYEHLYYNTLSLPSEIQSANPAVFIYAHPDCQNKAGASANSDNINQPFNYATVQNKVLLKATEAQSANLSAAIHIRRHSHKNDVINAETDFHHVLESDYLHKSHAKSTKSQQINKQSSNSIPLSRIRRDSYKSVVANSDTDINRLNLTHENALNEAFLRPPDAQSTNTLSSGRKRRDSYKRDMGNLESDVIRQQFNSRNLQCAANTTYSGRVRRDSYKKAAENPDTVSEQIYNYTNLQSMINVSTLGNQNMKHQLSDIAKMLEHQHFMGNASQMSAELRSYYAMNALTAMRRNFQCKAPHVLSRDHQDSTNASISGHIHRNFYNNRDIAQAETSLNAQNNMYSHYSTSALSIPEHTQFDPSNVSLVTNLESEKQNSNHEITQRKTTPKPVEVYSTDISVLASQSDTYKNDGIELQCLNNERSSSGESRKLSMEIQSRTLNIQPECVLNASQSIEEMPNETYMEDIFLRRPEEITTKENSNEQIAMESEPPHDSTHAADDKVYSGKDLNVTSVAIPQAHSSTNVDSILSSPLDLSGRTETSSNPIIEEISYDETDYVSYETLDLSHKASKVIENVVDLRVKCPELPVCQSSTMSLSSNEPPICHPSTLGMISSNLIENENSLITDLSIRECEDEYTPTDLSMNSFGREESENIDQNVMYDSEDLSDNIEINVEEETDDCTELDVDKDSPTDLSYTTPMNVSNLECQGNQTEEYTNLPDSAANLSGKINTDNNDFPAENEIRQPTSPVPESLNTVSYELNRDFDKSELISRPTTTDDTYSTEQQNSINEASLEIPRYITRAMVSSIETSTSVVPEVANVDNSVSPSSPLPFESNSNETLQDPIITETPVIPPLETQDTFNHAIEHSNIVGNVSSCTLPDSATSSLNELESSEPVYTLANTATVNGTITDTNNTKALPTKAETNVASNASIYIYENNASVSDNDISSSGPQAEQANLDGPADDADDQNAVIDNEQIDRVNEEIDETVANALTDQDQETARQIALLPKELVDILGTMPVDHRKQLLNVLPQYVSTSTALSTPRSEANESAHTSSSESNSTTLPAESSQTVTSAASDTNDKQQHSGDKNICSTDITPSSSHDRPVDEFITHPSEQIHSSEPALAVPSSPKVNSSASVSNEIETITACKEPACINETNSQDCDLEIAREDTDNFLVDPYTGSINKRIQGANASHDNNINLTDNEDTPNIIFLNNDGVKLAEDILCPTSVQSEEMTDGQVSKTNKKIKNDKTASLRAVRIKTPSIRNKAATVEKPSFEKDYVQKPTLQVPREVNEENNCLNIDKSLTIRQTEASSTHFPIKKYNLNCKSSTSASTTYAENEKSHQKSNVLDVAPAGDYVSHHNHRENSIVESAPVTSYASKNHNENIAFQNTNHDDSNNVTYKSTCQNLKEVKETLSHNDDNTKMIPIPHQKQIIIPSPNGNISDDSEDDLSLAVIVQQKLRRNQKDILHKDTNYSANGSQNNPVANHKNKNTKVTTELVNKDVLRIDVFNQINNDLSNSKSMPLVNKNKSYTNELLITDLEAEETNLRKENGMPDNVVTRDIENKLSKKKFFKESSEIAEQQGERVEIGMQYEQDIDKENDISPESVNVKKLHDKSGMFEQGSKVHASDQCIQKLIGQKEQTIDEDISDVPVKMSENIGLEKEVNILQTQILPIEEIACKIDTKKSTNSVQKYSLNNKIVEVKAGKEFNDDEFHNVTEGSIIKQHNVDFENICESVANRSGDQFPPNENKHQDSNSEVVLNNAAKTLPAISNLENNIHSPYSKILSNEQTFKSDLQLCSEIKESVVTPLRRSRRGKSMFVDSYITMKPNETIQPESTLEHKTPLTKKQLIFSKMLLDEENQPKPPAHSTPEKDADDISDDSIIKNVSIVTSQISDTDSSGELDKKMKLPNKRKKSPQVKQNCKKKKNLETFQISDQFSESLNVNKSLNTTIRNNTKETHCESSCDTDSTPIESALRKDKTVQIQNMDLDENTPSKNLNESAFQIDTNIRKEIETVSNNETSSKNYTPLAEKRKRLGIDSSESLKPKKTKMNHSTVELNDVNTKPKVKALTETRTACYNMPIAAKRTRSKSVVVKSSGTEFYDPYDIDLDDMIEKTEPVITKRPTSQKTAKNHILKKKHSKKSNHKKSSKKHQSIATDTVLGKSTESKRQHIVDKDLDRCQIAEPIGSDSDDSSKSDVPLQKYKEKQKRSLKNKIRVSRAINDDDRSERFDEKPNSKYNKKSRRTLSVFNNVDSIATTNETDEQLRSEQFMESFGFFSERKPRKSNLLASKKISETFHIIANESDDVYFGFKQRSTKRSMQNENRKSVTNSAKPVQYLPTTKVVKRGPNCNKQFVTKILPKYCSVCKKDFRRPDNLLRHQMTLVHVSKLSELELKVKTVPVYEEPNYLIPFKRQIEKLRRLKAKLDIQKKNSKKPPTIVLPTFAQILAKVKRHMREKQIAHRGLSRDEALFIDCCELLKSHTNDICSADAASRTTNSKFIIQTSVDELDAKYDTRSDGDVDSITAKNILESEEVRNLENDLISGLKEAANASSRNIANINYQHIISNEANESYSETNQPVVQADVEDKQEDKSTNVEEYHCDLADSYDHIKKSNKNKTKKQVVTKEKMYPDIENIDLFEDKFDKIKRKCRSQAVAAKQIQPIVVPKIRSKGRKKSEKKKSKKYSKNIYHTNQVPTKGALKGFDGIKVSIPTSDINLSAIVANKIPQKKKKKNNSKRKRNKKESESSRKHENDSRAKDNSSQKKVDVYEFMDNEEAELFEFRPSTLMERFKSISNKDAPSTSKFNPVEEEQDITSDSASDGDDFVYMSDDYVCSDDETENSLLSCELGNGKVGTDIKKNTSPLKRKDAVEKNAVMGKIFKHNAVRSEKKSGKCKESVKPKANLDQLFDSLLEDEPSSSMLKNDAVSPREDDFLTPKNYIKSSKYDPPPVRTYDHATPEKDGSSYIRKFGTPTSKSYDLSPKKQALKRYSNEMDFGPSTSKSYDDFSAPVDYGPSTSRNQVPTQARNYRDLLAKKYGFSSSKKCETITSKTYITSPECDEFQPLKGDDVLCTKYDSREKLYNAKHSSSKKFDEGISTSYDYSAEVDDELLRFDDSGVARQRARRKCTVGKQNILAETWSSESEPDGLPPRPNSAESVLMCTSRKKKGKKKDGHQSSGRRNRQALFKKHDNDSRVFTSKASGGVGGGSAGSSRDCGDSLESDADREEVKQHLFEAPAPRHGSTLNFHRPRPRPTTSYWSSEGVEEHEHLQQHGWIVGDSHKKLVTMLAHAKGRKRNHDDKRHLVE